VVGAVTVRPRPVDHRGGAGHFCDRRRDLLETGSVADRHTDVVAADLTLQAARVPWAMAAP